LGVPLGLGFAAGSILPNLLAFYATATNLPGVKIQTQDVRRYGYGANEEKPVVPIFDGIDLVFFGDQQGGVLNYFQQWINYIVFFDSSHGFTSTSASGSQPYELQYKQNYATGATIELISPAGTIETTVTFNQAFPTFIKDVQLDWEDNKSVMKIPIHFSFYDYFQVSGNSMGVVGSSSPLGSAASLSGLASGPSSSAIGAGAITGGTITPSGTIGALTSLLTGPSSSVF
jgi:hypothetical protein